MIEGYRVIDAQRHVVEPPNLWNDRLGSPLRELVAVSGTSMEVQGRTVAGPLSTVSLMAEAEYRSAYEFDTEVGTTPEFHLAAMNEAKIDVAVIYPTLGMYVAEGDHISLEMAAALTQAYNQWLSEWCNADCERLKGLAILPLQDPEGARDELRRSVTELGLVGAVIRPNPLVGRQLCDLDYDCLYAEAERLNVPLVVSHVIGSALPELGDDRFDGLFARNACGAPFEVMLASLFFMGYNLLERFPALKVGFAGAGAGWLPYWLDRVDENWGGPFGIDAPSTLPPTFLFRRQGFAVLDPWEKNLADIAAETGIESLLWSSRALHPDALSAAAEGPDAVCSEHGLSTEERAAVLGGNAAAVFHI